MSKSKPCGRCGKVVAVTAKSMPVPICHSCRRAARAVGYIPPSRRGMCSDCGKVVQISKTSAATPRCLECRRANPALPQRKNPHGIEWVCGWCDKRCFRPPTKGQIPKYCSDLCQWSAADARRRLIRGEFMVSVKRRRRLYERDGWTCLICGTATSDKWAADDPWSPTLDHIEPRSHSLIPDDSDANLRTAHALCNQQRGAAVRTDEEVRTIALGRRRNGVSA